MTRKFLINFTLSLVAVVVACASATAARAQGETQPAKGAPAKSALKFEGQIVCSVCWFEADDRVKTPYGTASDLTCAVDCAAKGVDAALAVREGEGNSFALYLLEDGRFDKGAKDWLAFMGKRVEVSGTLRGAEKKKYLKVDALRVVADGAGGAGGAGGASVLQDAKVPGTKAELALRDLYGAEQRLSALGGRIVVLNFWATYCEPCRREMPDLARIQNEYAALGVQVVGASADAETARAKVLEFIRETKINFPVWLGATTGDMQRFGLAPVLPGTVIIGRDGRIAWIKTGIVKEADVKKKIDELLAASVAEGKPEPATGAAHEESGDARAKAAREAREDEHASTVPA